MAKHKISISFKRKYHDVYVYLNHLKEKHENVSDYICKLVQADMNLEERTPEVSQSDIERMIQEALIKANQASSFSLPQQQELPKKDKLKVEDIDLLNNLF